MSPIDGTFIRAEAFVSQTWAEGLDKNGRLIPRVETTSGSKGVLIHPGNTGGTNWWSPTHDPATKFFVVPAIEQGMVYFPNPGGADSARSSNESYPSGTGRSLYTSLRALDAETGKLIWEKRNASRNENNATGSVISTASGLLFGSDESTFFSLLTKSGETLWSFITGANISAAPISYQSDGKQFVAVIAGKSIIVFGLPNRLDDKPKKIIFK